MIVQTNILSGGGDGKIPQSHISGSSMEVCMGFYLRYNYIGVKHDFLCINIRSAPKVALELESVKQGFSEPQGAHKMFM